MLRALPADLTDCGASLVPCAGSVGSQASSLPPCPRLTPGGTHVPGSHSAWSSGRIASGLDQTRAAQWSPPVESRQSMSQPTRTVALMTWFANLGTTL